MKVSHFLYTVLSFNLLSLKVFETLMIWEYRISYSLILPQSKIKRSKESRLKNLFLFFPVNNFHPSEDVGEEGDCSTYHVLSAVWILRHLLPCAIINLWHLHLISIIIYGNGWCVVVAKSTQRSMHPPPWGGSANPWPHHLLVLFPQRTACVSS